MMTRSHYPADVIDRAIEWVNERYSHAEITDAEHDALVTGACQDIAAIDRRADADDRRILPPAGSARIGEWY